MIIKFVDREKELKFLQDRYKCKEANLIIIYGRRRVGKTELLLQFAKNKAYVYFLASETGEKDNLQGIFNMLYEFFKDDILTLEKTWENLFRYLSKKKRFVLIIDEFPYLISQNKALPSVFQKGWDLYLKKSNIFLVLAGSSIGMMEEHTLSYGSPLYGRRTGQWKVESLKFKELFDFFPNYSAESIVKVYGALDSIPAYLIKYDQKLNFWENLKKNNLSKGSFLYDEVNFLLKQELREPKIYKNILKAISFGNTKFGEIMNFTGIDKSKLFVYLDTLDSLKITEKKIPLLDKPKSKKGRYFIKDNFFKFWFRYILPNRSTLEEGKIDVVVKKIKDDYTNYIGRSIFESVCEECLWSVKLPFLPERMGKQWGSFRDDGRTKTYEIDIVTLNESKKQILFGECKWQNRVNANKILADLKEKTRYMNWKKDSRKEYYAIFAKSFKKRAGCYCFDLKDIEKVFKKSK